MGKRAFPYRGIDTGGSRGTIGPAVRVGGAIGARKRSSGDEAARVEGFGSRDTPPAGCRADKDRTGGESGV